MTFAPAQIEHPFPNHDPYRSQYREVMGYYPTFARRFTVGPKVRKLKALDQSSSWLCFKFPSSQSANADFAHFTVRTGRLTTAAINGHFRACQGALSSFSSTIDGKEFAAFTSASLPIEM